jgi:hypothetical protein
MTQDKSFEIESVIRSGIATWFPNVEIQQLITQSQQDSNTFTVFMRYAVIMTNIQDEILINFEQ